jgi:hypothetical protein
MENKKCENKCGMATNNREIRTNEFIRALNVFNPQPTENTSTSLPMQGNRINTHQTAPFQVERWQLNLAENQRHNTFR